MSDVVRTGSTAFVLAGGGTKGSFEAGALQYLIEVEGITPDIVTATSAGAIAATVLAQARTREEFVQRVGEIEDDILAMTQTDYVFGRQGWLRALSGTSLGKAIEFALTEGTRPPFPRGQGATEPIGPSGPTRAQRRAAAKARRQRQRTVARLVTGAAIRLPRTRRQLRTSGASVLTLDPLADAMRHGGPSGILPIDPALISRPGLQLRLAVTALRAGVLRYVTETGLIVEADARTAAPGAAAGPVPLIDGALASASVPLIFPPHPMADDDYVDGGVLQLIPVRAAAELGATRIIAIVAMPLALARDERDYASGPAVHIGLRALGMIAMAERQAENLATPLPPGTHLTTIDPIVDVVGLFEVEQGLLRINKDYGWLRAADIVAEGDSDLMADIEAQTHVLTQARVDAWTLEAQLWLSAPGDAVAGDLALVREYKTQIRELVDQRKQLGYPVPEGCESWYSEYEAHSLDRPAHLPAAPGARP
jgi:predicted acylesterase/phospholipase RssA